MNLKYIPLALAVLLCQSAHAQTPPADAPWVADLGDGRYRNPVLHADYSDPDAIRVGDKFYMTSSSFSNAPGLPLLESPDLVNWTLVGHALSELLPRDVFAKPQYGKGVWAPALRHHNGRFYIFYPDPDFGIYVTEAQNFSGPWSAPRLLLGGRGLIDPAPLWDDDGQAYLMHAWAFSRAGKNNVVTMRRMDAGATRILDGKGQDIINGADYPGYHTVEGPKVYKANGYYYVFAPAGGVEQGWQAVFRSRSLTGPYEVRNVLAQGDTPVNGPHQGAWVDAPDGRHWFLHFQDKGPYGRVVHLQPMQWKDGWPLIGQPGRQPGTGEPVITYTKPVQGKPLAAPPTIDDFSTPQLGLQWQWGANPQPSWYSLSAKPGALRLYTQPLADADDFVRASPAILTQKAPASRFLATTRVRLEQAKDGDRAGLIINAMQYAWVGLRRNGTVNELVWTVCGPFGPRCKEQSTVILSPAPTELTLRAHMNEGAFVNFAYSVDGKTFKPVGSPFPVTRGTWVGAQVGLFSAGRQPGSWLDVEQFELTAPGAGPY
ncbi:MULTISPECIES: glycoside hydrolase 43 family protein [unclassified Duganella]|uniref:glycoside hydrolase family 43 protein n=1 Tax=unclassified Duganella TaxID=2636909 RepID=UPI00088EABB9|nr:MULTISPECIES: glycoside hydrolase 43 family protein [unclassified Duganella]SDF66099.1 Beta-xylosidase [Duganella sp. OV458]SDI62819.1 Beta-xylosidase [Duganella sp. OV510]